MEQGKVDQISQMRENTKEVESLVKLIKDVQENGGVSTVIVFSRKGRLEIYNGLVDNLYIISARLKAIADNETNLQINSSRARMQASAIVQAHGGIITN